MLQKVAKKIRTGRELMGSVWQNAECEAIATQTISACAKNEAEHNDAFSWLHSNATAGRASCGTNNAKGLARLIDEGYLTKETYEGTLTPPNPDEIAMKGKKFLILRVTDKLLQYANSKIK